MSGNNIKVAIKVRPLIKKEKDLKPLWKVVNNSIQLIDSQSEPFHFDHIFDQNATNQDIYNVVVKPIINATFQGINGTIFAYGQTSSGKTYTMLGNEENPGIMALTVREIFRQIEANKEREFLIRVGYIEIYNEKIYDLLNKKNQDLKIHENANGDISLNCEEFIITSEEKMLEYLQEGSKQRKIGETNMNERSSRSHTIFRIIIESGKINKSADDDCVQISNLNLVDLAGSERADQTGATGSRLKEGGHINRSLLSLSCVINKLSENESDKFINYRDSKLTRILQASLGGNALTAIICNIKPTAVEETSSTLNFAVRAKSIKNKPKVNEVISEAAMMKKLQKEIIKLRTELETEKSKNSQIKILQLEKQIKDEELKIMHFNSIRPNKSTVRRRTWCPTTVVDDQTENSNAIQIDMKNEQIDPKILQTPLITIRDHTDYMCLEQSSDFSMLKDNYFLDVTTISTNIENCENELKTPEIFQESKSLTPPPDDIYAKYKKLEQEYEELKSFTNLEKQFEFDYDNYKNLCEKLTEAHNKIVELDKERHKFQIIEKEIQQKKIELFNFEERCQLLERKLLENDENLNMFRIKEKTSENKLEQALKKISQLEIALKDVDGFQFQYEQDKKRFKRREQELLDVLENKEREIKGLKQMKTSDADKIDKEIMTCSKDMEKKDIEKNELFEKNLRFEKLLEENMKLSNEYTELSNQIIDSVQECDDLKELNSKIQTELSIYKKERNSLISILRDYCKISEESKENSYQHSHKIDEIKENDDLKLDLKTLLVNTMNSLSSEKDKHNLELEEKIIILESNNQILNKDKEEQELVLKKFSEELNKKEQKLQDFNKEYEHLENVKDKLQNNVKKLENEIRQLQTQIECANNENTFINEQKIEMERLKKDFEQRCHDYEIEKLHIENDFVFKIDELQKKLEYWKNENDLLKKQIDNYEKMYEEKINNMNQLTINEIEKKYVEIEEINIELRKRIEEIDSEKSNVQNDFTHKIENLETENIKLQKLLQDLMKEIDSYKKKNLIVNMKNDQDKINEELQLLVKELKSLTVNINHESNRNCCLYENSCCEKYLPEMKEVDDEVDDVKIECIIDVLKNVISNLKHQYQQWELKYNELNENYQKIQEKLKLIQKENNELDSSIKRDNILMKQLQDECTALKTSTEELMGNVIQIEKEKNIYELDNNRLRMEIKNLEEQLTIQVDRNEVLLKNIKNHETKLLELESLNKKPLNKNSEELEIQEKNKHLNSSQLTIFETDQYDLVNTCKKHIEKLRLKLSKSEKENTDLQLKLISSCNDVKKLEISLEKSTECLCRIEKEYAAVINEKIKLQEGFDKVIEQSKEFNEYIRDYQELKTKTKMFKEENSKLVEELSKIQKPGIIRNKIKSITEMGSAEGNNSILKFYESTKYASLNKEKYNGENNLMKSREYDRKAKRRSSYDEKRFALWNDHNEDKETMTDPVDQLCNCETLDKKIKDLQRKVRIQECQINTLQMEAKCNPLIEENKTLTSQLLDKENKNKKLKVEISNLKEKILELSKAKLNLVNKLCQTEYEWPLNEIKSKTEFGDLEKQIFELRIKYKDAKKICRIRKDEIEKLKESDNKNLKEEYENLKKEHLILGKKYEEVKFLLTVYKEERSQQGSMKK